MWKLALALLTTFSLPTLANHPWRDSYGTKTEAGSFFMDRCYAFSMNMAVERGDDYIDTLSVYKQCKCQEENLIKSTRQRCPSIYTKQKD